MYKQWVLIFTFLFIVSCSIFSMGETTVKLKQNKMGRVSTVFCDTSHLMSSLHFDVNAVWLGSIHIKEYHTKPEHWAEK